MAATARPCKYCENPVAPNVKRCPKCGGKKPYPPEPTTLGQSVLGLVILAAIVYGVSQCDGSDGKAPPAPVRPATAVPRQADARLDLSNKPVRDLTESEFQRVVEDLLDLMATDLGMSMADRAALKRAWRRKEVSAFLDRYGAAHGLTSDQMDRQGYLTTIAAMVLARSLGK